MLLMLATIPIHGLANTPTLRHSPQHHVPSAPKSAVNPKSRAAGSLTDLANPKHAHSDLGTLRTAPIGSDTSEAGRRSDLAQREPTTRMLRATPM